MTNRILSLTFVLVAAAYGVAAQSADTKVIDRFISAQAAKEKGEEPDGIRKMAGGDLNHDGVSDVAVLYTIEGQNGSNDYIQYLAVFRRTGRGLVYAGHRAVGGKNRRQVELTRIEHNLIYVDTMGYGPRDPSCCPTKKGGTTFLLKAGVLKEGRRIALH